MSLVAGKSQLRVLDLCASPGGKSTLVAGLLDKESLLISNEVIRARASILDENAVRWGYTNHWVTCNDPRDFGHLTGYFDVVIADVPCSGSGLYRKDERAINEWSESNVGMCSARQQRILTDIMPALKQDGILIYATCSYSPEEDEQILDSLAQGYNVTSLPVPLDDSWGIVEVTSPVHKMMGYRFFPHRVKGEGFFIAALMKNDEAAIVKQNKGKSPGSDKTAAQAAHLLEMGQYHYLQKDKETYAAINVEHVSDKLLLEKLLYFRKIGIHTGSPSAKEWLPAHDIALSVDAAKSLSGIEVNKEQALKFLKREEINLPDNCRGWHIIRYNGLGLGWIKGLGNRANNYLPKHWRIRMEIPE